MKIPWIGLPLALLLSGGVLFAAEPPPRLPAGFYLTPSFSIAEEYNDNILATHADRKKDFITRMSPGLLAGYESTPFTLLGGYGFDGEIFAQHSSLNEAMARQKATLETRYLPTRLLTLALKGEYTETQTPRELNVATAIAGGRVRAQRFAVDPSVAYRFDPLSTGTVGYSFGKDEIRGGVTTDTHTGRFGFERRITPRDLGSIEYRFSQFSFGGRDETKAYTIQPGWTHDFTPLTSVTLKAGPRFSSGSVDADVSASIRHKLEAGEIGLLYARSQTTVVGESGTATSDSVSLPIRYKFLPRFEAGLLPSFSRTTRSSFETKVYGMKLDGTYEITKWLSLVASYEYRLQKGVLATAGTALRRHDDIPNNILFLKLEIKDRYRLF